jgi:tetratricopeptide (TPR) repeat protein
MYIRPPKKRRSSPIRVLILLVLIAIGGYILVYRRDMIQPIQIGPTPTPTATADDIMAQAHELYLDGDLNGAIEMYSQAAALDPLDPIPYAWWSQLLTLRKRTEQAVQKAREAVGIAPDSAEAMAALCMAMEWAAVDANDQAQLQEALSTCLGAIDLDPKYAEAHAYLAEVYADLGRSQQAVEEARLAVSLDDSSVFAHRDLGYALQKQRQYQNAVAEYQRASQLHPRLAQPYIDLGHIYRTHNRLKDALSAYEKATVVDPNSAYALDTLGWWGYFQAGDHQRAAVVLKKATEVDPTYIPAYGHLGLTYYVLRNYEDAIDAYKAAIDLGSTEVEYYYELGLAYAYLERCDEARPWLLKAVEIDNTAWPAWDGLDLCPEK